MATGKPGLSSVFHLLYSRKIEKKSLKLKSIVGFIENRKSHLFVEKNEHEKEREALERLAGLTGEKELELELLERDLARISEEISQATIQQIAMENEAMDSTDVSVIDEDWEQLAKEEEQRHSSLMVQYTKESKEYTAARAEYERSRIELEGIKLAKENLSKEGFEKIVEHKIFSLKSSIDSKEKNIQSMRQESEANGAKLEENKQRLVAVSQQLQEHKAKVEQVVEALTSHKEAKNATHREQIECATELLETRQAINGLSRRLDELYKGLQLNKSDLNLASLLRLQAKLQGTPGYYGFLIDNIEIPSKILHCVEHLFRGKLFSIIVEDEEVANKVLAVNRQIKGGKVNVYPLSWVDPQVDSVVYPPESESIIIHRHIRQKPTSQANLQNLIDSTFKGSLIVESLSDATRLSKSFDCTCITMENEIVYPKAFLSRLGYFDQSAMVLDRYLKYLRAAEELHKLQGALKAAEARVEGKKREEAEMGRIIAEALAEKEALLKEVELLHEDSSLVKKACLYLQKVIFEGDDRCVKETGAILLLNHEIESLSKSLSNGSRTELSKAEVNYVEVQLKLQELKERLIKKNKVLLQLEEKLIRSDKLVEKYNGFLNEERKKEASRSVRKLDITIASKELDRSHGIVETLKKSWRMFAAKKDGLSKELEGMRQSMARSEEALRERSQKERVLCEELQQKNQTRFDLQAALDSLEGKVRGLNVDCEREKAELRELKGKSDKELIKKLQKLMINKLKYTQQDKANFERLQEYFCAHGEYRAELEDLKESKKEFYSIIGTLC